MANLTWNFAWDVHLGAIFMARSGLPYSHLANVDQNSDGDFGNDRQLVNGADTGRNAFRHPSLERCDVRLQKTVKLGGAKALDLAPNLDVPNAQTGDPLTGQLSVRVRF